MKYEVWQKENEPEETTLINVKNKRKEDIEYSKLLTSFEAKDFDEAIKIYNKFMNFD